MTCHTISHYIYLFYIYIYTYIYITVKIKFTLTQIICHIRCVVQALCDVHVFYYRLKVETCTYLQPISNNYIKKGWVRKSTKLRWISNRRWAMSQKGRIRIRIRNVKWDPTRKTWISMKSTTVVARMNLSYMQQTKLPC